MGTKQQRWAGAALAALLTVVGLTVADQVRAIAASPSAPTPATTPGAGPTTPGRWSGQAAVDRLGDRLPAVAAANRTTAAELRTRLLADRSLHVDAADGLFYVDEAVRPDAVTAAATWGPYDPDPTIPDSDTFLLHSKPGSSKVIYLDFDGLLLSGTAWNAGAPLNGANCQAEPFDFDSPADPTVFSAAERASIKSIWKRVAEDYAPFDVDVTTQDPGADAINRSSTSDNLFGSRALITTSTQPCYANGPTLYSAACNAGCGGVAYVGVFNSANNGYNQPALIFTNGTGGGMNPKYVAEAASHEVGHNIGLSHDGTSTLGYYQGQGSWAPIMGVGYYEPIVQWSKGEYADANQKQDDFAVAQSYGLPLRADDHGNTAATATALTGTSLSATGVISTATDVDAFTFPAGPGAATFTVDPALTSPDLDVKLELRDATGALLASSDPASGGSGDTSTGMAASISYTFAATDTYTLLVDGVGVGDPTVTGYSDYGSVGVFRITGTVPPGNPVVVGTSSLAGGTVGVGYSQTLTASGGAGSPYTWTVTSGSLPAGLTLSTGGVLSGTPTTAGSSTFTVRATDGGGVSGIKSLSVVIAPPPVAVTTATLPNATINVAYPSTQLSATGGIGSPYTWTRTAGTLPTGITLSSTGVLSGTPSATGTFSFTVQATDGGGNKGTAALSIGVYSAVTISTASLPAGGVGTAYSQSLTATGGRTAYTWSISGGTLPTGITLSTGGVLSGTPSAAGTFSFTVRVTDADNRTATRSLSIVIAAPPGLFAKSSPANGATGVSLTTKPAWGASTGATRYEICFTTTAPATSTATTCPTAWVSTGTTRTYTPSGLTSLTTYYWQVRAFSAAAAPTYANGTVIGAAGTWWSYKTK